MSETALSRSIRKALESCGVWCVRIPAGQYRVTGGRLHVAEPGFPDLLCICPFGLLEVKVGRAKLRPEQAAWHGKAMRRGVRVAVVRSSQDALAVVRRWADEDAALRALRRDREALEKAGLE